MDCCGDKRDDGDDSAQLHEFVKTHSYKLTDKFHIGVKNIPIIPMQEVGQKFDEHQIRLATEIAPQAVDSARLFQDRRERLE